MGGFPIKLARLTAHRFQSKADRLLEGRELIELEGHSTFADVEQLAPIVLAEIHEYDHAECSPWADTAIAGAGVAFLSCRRERHGSISWLCPLNFGLIPRTWAVAP